MKQMSLLNTIPSPSRVIVAKTVVPIIRLEAWAHALTACANEAVDDNLFALETDIRDIRDEIYSYLP